MGTLPTYLLTHTDEQRLVIFRTDGADITDKEAEWFRQSITAALRTEALMKTAGTNLNAVLNEPDVSEGTSPRTGATVGVHPLVNQIKRIIKRNRWSLAKVSRLLGKGDAAVSTWFRGQAQPTLKDVYGLFGMAGYKLMPIPLEIVNRVETYIAHAEAERLKADESNALG
jgi:hypothetical protein